LTVAGQPAREGAEFAQHLDDRQAHHELGQGLDGGDLHLVAPAALVVARVLEIRRGDGTYVTSLEPALLLESLGSAVELLRGDKLLELTEVRRLFEPIATGLAAGRITEENLAEIKYHLDAMTRASDDVELLNEHDTAFHRAVIASAGNGTLATLLEGISSRTVRARVWRGLVDDKAGDRTVAEHRAIYNALVARNGALAEATALIHVSTTEQWLREHFDQDDTQSSADSRT
jgi:GntR family transcriptional repressor for pyruvate dehydrogenase complex